MATQQNGRHRWTLLAATTLLGGLVAVPAAAQDASQLAAIQAQISQLQAELRRLQRQAAARDAALKKAQADAAQARAEASQAMQRAQATPTPTPTYAPAPPPPGNYAQGPAQGGGFSLGTPNPGATSLQSVSPASITTTLVDQNNPTLRLGGVTVTLGGYLDTTALYRSRNLTGGISTSFNSIPFSNNVNAHLDEFRMTAQPSRFSLLVQGNPGPDVNLAGYAEFDLNGAATTSNSNQSNSYTPRLRLAYAQYDDTADGWHVLTGQEWSLATGNLVGITPRKELVPPTIDANYLPGYVYTRQPQIRVVKDFGQTLWLGASLEAPQETYSFTGVSGFASGSKLPGGQTITFNSSGGSYLNSTTT
jgi:hypothetical protein